MRTPKPQKNIAFTAVILSFTLTLLISNITLADTIFDLPDQIEMQFDNTFGDTGTHKWLIDGTAAPAEFGITGANPEVVDKVTFSDPTTNAVIESSEYYDKDPSSTSYSIVNLSGITNNFSFTNDGYLRSFDSGIYCDPAASIDNFTNNGYMYIEDIVQCYGIKVESDSGYSLGGLYNTGTIYAFSQASSATSVDLSLDGGVQTFNNSGNIYAITDSSSYAICVNLDTRTDINIVNSGTIYGKSLDTAVGYICMNHLNSNFSNSGSIFVTGSYAKAIFTHFSSGTFTNETSGKFVVNGTALGIAFDMSHVENCKFINKGEIWIDAPHGAAFGAFYDYMPIPLPTQTATISNPGTIWTSGGTRTIYVDRDGMLKLDGDFSFVLEGDPTNPGYVEEVYIEEGSSLNLNNANLLVRTTENTVLNTPYKLIDLQGGLNGDFASACPAACNPNIGVDWNREDLSVTLSYSPTQTPANQCPEVTQETVCQSVRMVQDRMVTTALMGLLPNTIMPAVAVNRGSSPMLADADFNAYAPPKSNKGAVFFQPYYTKTDRESTAEGLGYDAEMTGFTLGYDWYCQDMLAGLHAGYGRATIDFSGVGFNRNSEDQNVFSGGLHASKRWDSNFYTGLSSTFYTALHDYSGRTGVALTEREHADYESYGIETRLVGGYIFECDDIAIMPELGISHTWAHRKSYKSDATDPAWDTSYSGYDDNIVKSIVGGRAMGSWCKNDTTIVPSVSVNWEHALTNNDTTVSQSIPGSAPVTITDDISNDSLITNVSLTFVKKDTSLEVGYTNEYNQDLNSHGLYATIRWEF